MRWLILPFLYFFWLPLHAQQLPLETYTPANGLVDARVIKVFQDSKGRIYFLTREGFSIFDGQRFTNYGNESNKRTEIINIISEYKDGTVKLFSFDGNIYSVQGNEVSIDSSHRKLLTEVNIMIEIAADERLIATNNLLLKEKNNKLETIPIPYQYTKAPRIENLFWANPYLIFLRTLPAGGNALYLYNYSSGVMADTMPLNAVSMSAADKKANVFLYTKSWMQIDPACLQQGKLKLVPAYFTPFIPASFIAPALSFDNNNDLWLCDSDKGYCKIDSRNKTQTFFTGAEGLLSGARFVFQDAENNYWFISSANGVQKMQQSPLSLISNFKNIPSGYVTTINSDEKGNSFVFSINGFFLNGEKVGAYDPGVGFKPFYYNGQYWKFPDTKTLVGSKGTRYNLAAYIPGDIHDIMPSFASTDREGRLILAGNIMLVIDKQDRLYTYRLPYFCDNIITDEQNNYWCFTRSNYVIKLAWKNGKLVEIYKELIPDLNPRFAIMWTGNTILVGTRFEGIKIFSWNNNKLTASGSITKRNGLSNNFIYSLLKRNDQQLLVGTGTGLVLLTMNTQDTIAENLSLRNNIYPPFIYMINTPDSSTICLTGSGSLYLLQKDTRFSSGYVPTAFFRSVSVNGNPVNEEARSFSYNRNNFTFSVSAPSFLDNKNMKFYFYLKGAGTTWVQHTASADYTINNLPPGNYDLTVVVQYPGRFYPDKQLTYSFTIKNPFWKEWWFIALCAVTAVVMIYLILNNYYRKQLEKKMVAVEKQQAVETERSRIAADMHDDLGSGLTKITYLSQMALNKEDSKTDLQAIKKTSTELVENMSEIIWAMKEENNSLEDLLYYIKIYAVEYCASNNLDCTIDYPEKIPGENITGQNRRNIYLAAKETLHNIVKHAQAKHVIIKVIFDNGWILGIKDDGKGFSMDEVKPGQLQGGNGLKNIMKRIEAVNGTMEIINSSGTEMKFYIPFSPAGLG